jgi:hypothetical protein
MILINKFKNNAAKIVISRLIAVTGFGEQWGSITEF